jgi:hypothetical protein
MQERTAKTSGGFGKIIIAEETSYFDSDLKKQEEIQIDQETTQGNLNWMFQRIQFNVLKETQTVDKYLPNRIYLRVGKVKNRDDREFRKEQDQGYYESSDNLIRQLVGKILKTWLRKMRLDNLPDKQIEFQFNEIYKEMIELLRARAY